MSLRQQVARHQLAVSVVVLAVLAYVPAFTAAPGRMPADSKLYVYLDPSKFLGDTTQTFDPRLYAGWVPHQHIAYLWPTGPWFWFFERLGVPDWIAHRLWIGTLLLLAGLGVRWAARVLGLGPTAALTAAIVYQLSPYILPYVSRTSVLLLPYAGLGSIVALTILAAQRGRWRFAAGVALVVFSVGAVNATALAMIIPAPLLWLIHAMWQRSITWRRALATAVKVGVLSIAVSLWWMVMLVIQGRRGADVLAYSESLESVSFTSTSTEVIRGLGYWLFYIRDAFGATTTASLDYLASSKVIAVGIGLLAVCLFGLVVTVWEHRRYAALLIGVGAVIAVGVHPIETPSPFMGLLVGDGEDGLALALRSSTRAVPVLVFGVALTVGALVAACRPIMITRPALIRKAATSVGTLMAVVTTVLAIANLPALRTGGFVDPLLERDQDPPQAWLDAAARLEELPDGYRVLQLPGAEFGAFRWGYTSDQPLPALTDRPVVVRDLLPLGSSAAMDLVFALDDRFQDGVADADAVSPIARLLGVDTVWVAGDVDFDRYRLARPEIVDDLLTGPGGGTGLLPAERFGEPEPMVADVEIVDEQSVSDARVGAPISPVSLVGVADPIPTIRVKNEVVVVSGSGDGLIDAAGAGVIDGSELVIYSASLDTDELADVLGSAERLVVTDSNRDRAHHWRSSQDVTGYTETGGPDADVLRFEGADQRLELFDVTDESTQTVSIQRGSVQASASAYGEPFAYLPEHRPVMAIDGDSSTAWLVADRAPAVPEYIRFDVAEPIDHLTLRQPDRAPTARRITSVELAVDDRQPVVVELGDESLVDGGQQLDIDPTTGPSTVTVTILSTSGGDPDNAVGFAEVEFGLGGTTLAPTQEVIRLPQDGLDVLDGPPPLSIVVTRLRTDPTDRWRSDPEPTLVREFTLERGTEVLDAAVTVRADRRLDDAALAALLAEPVVASAHLGGVPAARGASAFDGDPATAWITPFGDVLGQRVTAMLDGAAGSIEISQPAGTFSPITSVRITDAEGSFDLMLDPAVTVYGLPRPISLADVSIEITGIDERTTRDRRFGEVVTLPAAISEVTFDGRSPSVEPLGSVVADCRDDLLTVDGRPIGVSFDVSTDAIVSGAAIDASLCEPLQIGPGTHLIESAPGTVTGFHVDQVVLAEPGVDAGPPTATPTPTSVEVVSNSRDRRVVEVGACPAGCWLVLGEGFNTGWTASIDGGADLGEPLLVDGNANGWYIEPTSTSTTVTMEWRAQRWLDGAFVASLLGVLTALALVLADRRRDSDVALTVPPPRLAHFGLGSERTWDRRRAVATLIVTVVAGALMIDWQWGLVAAAAWLVAYLARSPRVLVAIGVTAVVCGQLIMLAVVLSDRPFPTAGFPVRFEWLHPWTLLGIVVACAAALFDDDSRVPAARRAR